MALKPCLTCNSMVSTKAQTCPKCGSHSPHVDIDVRCSDCGVIVDLESHSSCPECGNTEIGSIHTPSESGGLDAETAKSAEIPPSSHSGIDIESRMPKILKGIDEYDQKWGRAIATSIYFWAASSIVAVIGFVTVFLDIWLPEPLDALFILATMVWFIGMLGGGFFNSFTYGPLEKLISGCFSSKGEIEEFEKRIPKDRWRTVTSDRLKGAVIQVLQER